jgi:ubiquinone/menaquinone biosynthesis C-methylase UbiE/uncharacterized protein YbaR (Trm112 family)
MIPSFLDLLRCPQHPDDGRLDMREMDAGSGLLADGKRELKCLACGLVYPVVHGVVDMLEPLPKLESTAFLEAEARQWDEHTSSYDKARSNDIYYFNCIRAGLRALNPQTEDLILDAGCGTGMGTRLLHRQGLSTVALDLSLKSLEHLSRHVKVPGISFVRADICKLPFASKVFDKIICANLLQHLPNWEQRKKCVEQLARVVKPAGTVVMTAHGFSIPKQRAGWQKEGAAKSGSGDVQYIYRFEEEEFRELLSSSLRVISITGAGLPLPYRLKLSPLSLLIERVLSQFQFSAPWGHMLVGKCSTN